MKKIVIVTLFMLIKIFSYSEIKFKAIEPMRFKNINTTTMEKDKVLGIAIIEIYTDNKKEDIGKKIKIDFPEFNLLTNRRKWIRVEKITTDEEHKAFILNKERVQIKVYGILDRKELNRGEQIKDIEGEYIGELPIIISQYIRKEESFEKD